MARPLRPASPIHLHLFFRLPWWSNYSTGLYHKSIFTRWSNLDLHIPFCYYRHFCNHAPILKSIRFRARGLVYYGMMQPNFQLTCPRLERACLSTFPMDGANIQWDNLTHLTLYHMSIFRCLLILRETPRLVFCKVSDSSSVLGDPRIKEPFLTPLISLQLLIPSYAEDFLKNFIAPHLEEFSLPNYYNPSKMEVITSFLRRSACSLRSFSIMFSIFAPYFENLMIFC